MLIPRPETRLVQDVVHVLSATHSPAEIQRFKSLVREAYRRYLDSSVDFESQDTGRLLQFRKDVLQNDSKMNQYQHQWPTDAYGKIWSRYYRWRKARKVTKPRQPLNGLTYRRTTRKNGRPVDPTGRLLARKIRITFVGKPPRHRFTQKSKKRINRRDQDEAQQDEDKLTLTQSRSQNALSVKSSEYLPSSHSTSTRDMQGAHQPSATQTTTQENPSLLKCYPSPCAFCNYLPTMPKDIRSQLFKLFFDIPHVVSRLESSGLVHDLHLEMLLRWNREDRQEFCNRLPQNLFSTLDLITITTRLVEKPSLQSKGLITTSANAQGEQQRTVEDKCENVPWPDDSVKRLLMTSPDILSELKRAMGQHGSEELLTRLTELADQHGALFLQNYRPYEQRSCGRLNDTVKKILEAEQRLCRFEDAWPVRFYLQRRASDQSQQPPRSNCTTTNVPPDFSNDHKHPTIANAHEITQISTDSECPIHLQPDLTRVSESIIKFFSKHCSQELLIPLVLVGVTTDQQFEILRSMSPEQVESLVTRTDQHATRASLNSFQCILLKILLRD